MVVDVTLRNARISGQVRDLHIIEGVLAERSALGADRVDLDGMTVLPGLHDHHIHLAAAAASAQSVSLGPQVLASGGGLAGVLRAARRRQPSGWLRGVGYDLTQSGWIDRRDLDSAQVGPVRVQDRTGSRWVIDSSGLTQVLSRGPWPDGVQRDPSGRPTGHLVRLDAWLRDRLPPREGLDWAGLGRELAALGITAVTDAGHLNDLSTAQMLAGSPLPQRIRMMTAEPVFGAGRETVGRVVLDAVKVVLDDDRLPALETLRAVVDVARSAGRGVAIHCVTDLQLGLAMAAGLGRGDRVEHANVVPDGYARLLAEAGVAVCSQPGLISARGDRYLDEVAPDRCHELFRLRTLQGAGVVLLGGSDAPVGPISPWLGVEAAVSRTTGQGHRFGVSEALPRAAALGMYLRGGERSWPRRSLRPGQPADLLVMGGSGPFAPEVVATLIGGDIVHGAL